MDPRIFLLAAGLLLASCSSPGTTTHCTPQPAFQLTVRAADTSSLPTSTTVQIRYGGQNEETYRLDAPLVSPQALFCHGASGGAGAAGAAGAGPGGSGAGSGGASSGSAGSGGASGAGSGGAGSEGSGFARIECELWTDGAAQVIVEAPGYRRYDQELAATKDGECGVKTTDVQVTLQVGTAGSGGTSAGGGGS